MKVLKRKKYKYHLNKIKSQILPMVTKEEFRLLQSKALNICYMRKGKDKTDCDHEACKYQRRRNTLILEFLWDTGARVSEVAGVRIKDLNKEANHGRFHESYTKRSKSRFFKLHPDLYKDLLKFIKEEKHE